MRAAPTPTVAGPGLSVVAALTAQGIASSQAVSIVVGALRGRHAVADLLNLPSVARALQDQGMSPGEAGRRILDGDGDGGGGHGGYHPGGDGGSGSGVPPWSGHGHGSHPPGSSDP